MCMMEHKRTPNLEINSPYIQSQLRLKLQAEERMSKRLRRFFKAFTRDLKSNYLENGTIISARERSHALAKILFTEMMRTSRAFSGQLRDDIKSDPDLEYKELTDDEISALNRYELELHAQDQAERMLNNVDKTVRESLSQALSNMLFENTEPTRERIIAVVALVVGAKLLNRVDTISTTETQFAAERSKLNEATVVSRGTQLSIGGRVAAGLPFKKQWNTVLDNRTRTSHALADGQRVPLKQPFIVQGQSLMHPRDTSMGATLDNVINCRCSARYKVGSA